MTLKGTVVKAQAKGAAGRIPYKGGRAVWYRMPQEFGHGGAGEAGPLRLLHLACVFRLGKKVRKAS